MADPEDEDVLYEEVIDQRGLLQENSLRAILNGGTLGGPRRIKAATLPKLVDLIAAKHPAAHLPFEQMLVDCHSLYCSSAHFIDVIIAKYERVKAEGQSQAKIKTLRLLRMLLGELLLDNPESKAVETIRLFAQAQEAQFGSDILETIAQARSKEAPKSKAVWSHMEEDPDPPILLLPPDAQVTKLDEVDPRELAKQLTLLLAKEFARLRPREYAHFLRTKTSLFDLIYNHKLNDAQVQRKMGHLAAIISSFCGLVHWLRREINESVGPRRAKTLIYIFHFAWELFRMRNLHALGAVVLVLSPHFDDLQQMLSPADVSKLTELALLFHSSETETLDGGGFEFSHSTKRGRDLLYQTHSACLPFLGTYLHGMQIINATEAAFDDDQLAFLKTKNMLNLQKMERLSLVLKLLQQFQDRWYGYQQVETIQDYIKRGIDQGLRSMQLRPLGHLCREAVWRHKVEWRRHKLPCELLEFLAQHQVRLGDVLSVLSSL